MMIGLLQGVVASAFVTALFHNMQLISDSAPAAIRESSMPGLLGGVVGLVAVGWFILIPLLFVRHVTRQSTGGRRASPFVKGAFAGLAGYFLIFHSGALRSAAGLS